MELGRIARYPISLLPGKKKTVKPGKKRLDSCDVTDKGVDDGSTLC